MKQLPWSKVALLALDVDGVLTDGHLLIDGSGGVVKRFFVRDGSGIVRVRRLGIGMLDHGSVRCCHATTSQRTRHRSTHRRLSRQRKRCNVSASVWRTDQVAYVMIFDLPALKELVACPSKCPCGQGGCRLCL